MYRRCSAATRLAGLLGIRRQLRLELFDAIRHFRDGWAAAMVKRLHFRMNICLIFGQLNDDSRQLLGPDPKQTSYQREGEDQYQRHRYSTPELPLFQPGDGSGEKEAQQKGQYEGNKNFFAEVQGSDGDHSRDDRWHAERN